MANPISFDFATIFVQTNEIIHLNSRETDHHRHHHHHPSVIQRPRGGQCVTMYDHSFFESFIFNHFSFIGIKENSVNPIDQNILGF